MIGTSVTGSLQFNSTGTPNYFDPANGFVPAGYLNAAGPMVVISPTSTEFGFSDGANIDTADFTGTALTVTDDVLVNATNWIMTFTDTAFTGLNLVQGTDTFTNGGVTGALLGDKITLDWAGYCNLHRANDHYVHPQPRYNYGDPRTVELSNAWRGTPRTCGNWSRFKMTATGTSALEGCEDTGETPAVTPVGTWVSFI